MNIGSVKKDERGQLVGRIATMGFDAQIGFRPVASTNARAPKFDIVALNVARRWVVVGALWEKEAEQTGECYLTGHLDDPAFSAKLYIAAFQQEDGSYSIAWSRPTPQAAKGGLGRATAVPSFDQVEGSFDGEPDGPDNGQDSDEPAIERPRGRRRRAHAPDPVENPFADA